MPRASKLSRPVRRTRRPQRSRRYYRASPSRRRRTSALWALVWVGAFLSGCDLGSDPASSRPALTRGEFIEVYVALRNAELDLEVADSVPEGRFLELRDSILAAHGVSEAELYAFVNAHPGMEYQAELWDSINRRLKRPLQLPSTKERQHVLPDSLGPLERPANPDAMDRRRPTGR